MFSHFFVFKETRYICQRKARYKEFTEAKQEKGRLPKEKPIPSKEPIGTPEVPKELFEQEAVRITPKSPELGKKVTGTQKTPKELLNEETVRKTPQSQETSKGVVLLGVAVVCVGILCLAQPQFAPALLVL